MKKFVTLIILLAIIFCESVAYGYGNRIQYDYYSTGFDNERTGSVWLNGEKYNVKETDNYLGGKNIEIKNYNNTYRGTVNQFGYGTLKDYTGNTIEVKPY